MNVALVANTRRLDLVDRYLATNERYGNPFSIALSYRGHYSEINCLLAGMIYGLMKRRRFIVDQSDFDGLKWSDLYASRLPTATSDVIDRIDPDWAMLINEDQKPRFGSVRRRVQRRFKRHLPVWDLSIGLAGGVFPVIRQLADAFCVPIIPAAPPALMGRYAAVHVRRGDKLTGTLVDGSWTLPEADKIPAEAYLRVLREKAPTIKSVWVMSDDYAAVDELRSLAPDLRFETFCQPSETGYHQPLFSARSLAEKTAERQRLIAETEIALRSEVFVGCFLSNVDRFIVLRHQEPSACFSVDRQTRWFPG